MVSGLILFGRRLNKTKRNWRVRIEVENKNSFNGKRRENKMNTWMLFKFHENQLTNTNF